MNIVFTPSGLKTIVNEGTTVLAAAQHAGVAIRSLCGGNGKCHQCWVEISDGKHAKFNIDSNSDSLSALSSIETNCINDNFTYENRRLACQAKITGNVVIDVPDTSQEHLSYVAKQNKVVDYICNPKVKVYSITLEIPTLEQNLSATDNIIAQLSKHNINAKICFNVLPGLQKKITETKGKLTVAVRDNYEVIAVYSKEDIVLYGAAIDIGSTTLAVYVYHLQTGNLVYETSAMNPQIRYGEDLMSRISYVMLNTGGDEKLTQAIQQKLEQLLLKSCDVLKIDVSQLLELSIVGNPIMHHVFLGLSPVELGQAPFTLATRDWLEVTADELNLDGIYKNTRISFLPLIAGHVGADTAAAYLSVADRMETGITLLVDIGTNAEIMLAKDGEIYATSSPTGPAFEGAEISCGVRASYGAIERVRIDKKKLVVRYKQIGDDAWSDEEEFKNIPIIGLCGSGIIEAIVALAECGVIDKSGLFVTENIQERFDKKGNMMRFLLIDGVTPFYIEQLDIRSIQLAKAALYAGVSLLMDYLNCKSLDKVLLAGAFGAHLDPYYVAHLGIIPSVTPEQITAIGNAAGIGASMTLLDKNQREILTEKVKKVVKIESANEPKFQKYFVEAMQFSVSPITTRKTFRKSNRRVVND